MLTDPKTIIRNAAIGLTPQRQMTVAECAAKYLHVGAVGGYQGPWLADKTPSMVEPMNASADRRYQAVVYVAPAQDGKTESLIMGRMAYSVLCEASDFMIVGPDRDFVQDLSERRIARAIDDSPELSKLLMRSQGNNRKLTKRFKNGPLVTIAYAVASKLSGKSVPVVLLTEIDRIRKSIGGQGSAFDMARKRTQTFGSRAKIIAESTPGHEVTDPLWEAPNPHHMPPADGISSLYMSGDRRRYYWHCLHCGAPMLVTWADLRWDAELNSDPMRAAESVRYACQSCGGLHEPHTRKELNLKGVWRSEYDVYGTGPRSSKIASFWKEGPAASMQTWQEMVTKYLAARSEYDRTGSQESLKTFFNLDNGSLYIPVKSEGEAGKADKLKAASVEIPRRTVPNWVRFVVTSVDVQKNRFVVQVHGYGEEYRCAVIDRFSIKDSERLYDDGATKHPVQPFVYAEDWEQLDYLVGRKYDIESGGEVENHALIVDSGGQDKATMNAYGWANHQIKIGNGQKVVVSKGSPSLSSKRVFKGTTDKMIGIPLVIYNPNLIKDEIAFAIDREEIGPNHITFPSWLESWFFRELVSEERGHDGRWVKRNSKSRNEALDLLVLSRVLISWLGYDRINWARPPAWCDKPLGNDGQRPEIKDAAPKKKRLSMAELSKKLNGGY